MNTENDRLENGENDRLEKGENDRLENGENDRLENYTWQGEEGIFLLHDSTPLTSSTGRRLVVFYLAVIMGGTCRIDQSVPLMSYDITQIKWPPHLSSCLRTHGGWAGCR